MILSLFIKFVYYSFKVFGLATVDLDVGIDAGKKVKSLSFKPCKCGILYNLSLIALMGILYYFALKVGFILFSVPERKQLDRIINNAHNLSAGLACLSILLYFCVSQKRTAEIANALMNIGESVIEIGNKNWFDGHRKLLRDIAIIVVLNLLTWLSAVATIDTSTFEICFSFIYKSLCHVIIAFTLMQYSVVLIIVRFILEAIIEHLNRILKDAFQLGIASSNSLAQFETKSFWRLSKTYLSICILSDNISQYYSLPMLLSLPYIFITLIFLSHHILQPVVVIGITVPVVLVFHCIFRILQFLVSLIILTKMATATVSKSKAVGKTINEHLGLSANRYADVKVYFFANYLLQRTCQFSVFGLFSIDASLLMSIVGSITTYLVICLQFQKSNSD